MHWGVFDKKNRTGQKACYKNTLLLIPELLQLFSKYEVHVTWATVGSLFAEDPTEWNQLKPQVFPRYNNNVYSAYSYVKENGLDEDVDWAHFAPATVKKILQFPGQELGTHTFSHFYCLEPEQSPEAFEADLEAAQKAAEKFNNKLVSLVFPRNQFEPEFLNICYRKGIRVVRSNPVDWFWKPVADSKSGFLRKVFRTGDAYVPLGKRTSFSMKSIAVKDKQPLQIPASRFLRPWHPKYKMANKVHLRRVMNELSTAAINNECYHLWWHPENFGYYPAENLQQLKILLDHYKKLKTEHGMMSWNMGEYIGAVEQRL